MDKRSDLVKVQFYEPDVGYENIWASHASGGAYAIESIPFFVYNISLKDLVAAHQADKVGTLSFDKILSKSGHKTIRARPELYAVNDEQGKQLLDALSSLGCEFELLPPRLIAIDVNSDQMFNRVMELLNKMTVPWESADPPSNT